MADLDLRIDQLPAGTPGPNDPIPFRDLTTGVTKKFLAGLVLPSPVSTDIEWDPDSAAAGDYDLNELVTYGGNIYQSAINNNPSIPGVNSDWTLLTRGSGSVGFWEAGVYLEDEVVKIFDEAGVGARLFRLDPGEPRPFNSTDFDVELAAGNWIPMFNEDFWPLSGSKNLNGAVTITSSSNEHINLLGPANFIVDRTGNRDCFFRIDPENGGFSEGGGFNLIVNDPGTDEGLEIRIDDIFFEVASSVNNNNRLKFRGDATPELNISAHDGFISIIEKDVTNNVTYSLKMDNTNYVLIQAQDNDNGVGTFINLLSNEIDIQHVNPVTGKSTAIVIGENEFSLIKDAGSTSTEISTDGLDINLTPDTTGFINLGITATASASFTQDHRMVIKVSGVEYYIPLQAV